MKVPHKTVLTGSYLFTSMHPPLTGTLWRLAQQGINDYKHPFFYSHQAHTSALWQDQAVSCDPGTSEAVVSVTSTVGDGWRSLVSRD